MRKFPTNFILALTLAALAHTGCSTTPDDNSPANSPATANAASAAANSNSAKDNTEELGMLVRLPIEPEEATWKELPPDESAGAPRRLVAVLLYTDANAEKIAQQASAHRPPSIQKFPAEQWFPAELVSQGELSGEATLRGMSYAPDDLIQPPYTEGTLTRIENTNYFVLDLTAR